MDYWEDLEELEPGSVSEGNGVKLSEQTGERSHKALLLNCRFGFCSGLKSGAEKQNVEEEVMFPCRKAERRSHKQTDGLG